MAAENRGQKNSAQLLVDLFFQEPTPRGFRTKNSPGHLIRPHCLTSAPCKEGDGPCSWEDTGKTILTPAYSYTSIRIDAGIQIVL